MISPTRIKDTLIKWGANSRQAASNRFFNAMSSAAVGSVQGGIWAIAIGFVATYFLFLIFSWIVPQCRGCGQPFCKYYQLKNTYDGKEFGEIPFGEFTIKKKINSDTITVEKCGSGNIFSIQFLQDDADSSLLRMVLRVDGHEIYWWETNNIAKNNVVFAVEHPLYGGGVITKISYPTSTAALVSWIREYGRTEKMWVVENGNIPEKKTMKEIKTDEEIKLLCGKLENIFDDVCLFNNKNDVLLFCVRTLNGWCQFLCIALSFAIGFSLWARWRLFTLPQVENENRKSMEAKTLKEPAITESSTIRVPSQEEIRRHGLLNEYHTSKKKEESFRKKWDGVESPQWFVYRNGLAFFLDKHEIDKPEKYLSLADIANAGKDMFATSRLYIHWMLDAIPAVGFLGTVIGIGQTMMGTGGILTDELGKQQSRIAEVALSLAFAFDTTLVALALSLIMGAWLTHRIRVEDESIDQVQRILIGKIQSSVID